MKPLKPGATIGIIGGGQLGRMMAVAAAQLGYKCHIFAPEEAPVGAEVAAAFTRAAYDDIEALKAFAAKVDVVTYEFENVAVEPLRAVAGMVAVHPSLDALAVAQDRLLEKAFVNDLGGRTAPWAAVTSREELDEAIARIGCPSILKTTRFGYDGKGQARVHSPEDAEAAWQAIGGNPAILEGFVRFEREFSVIVARGGDGRVVGWDVPDNQHENGILARCVVPAGGIIEQQANEARALAEKVAEKLNYVGVLTLEFFASAEGPVFNEMAPRVHNSGHWTIEGAITSQFENHVRAICGLPLGDAGLAARRVTMDNLIGEAADNWDVILADATAHLHLYGKGESRPGRKMGHVTRLEF